jgi:hypothetical protein
LLQTLEIHEVITTQAVDIQRAGLKRQVRDIANGARNFAMGLRRRMNALDARSCTPTRVRIELRQTHRRIASHRNQQVAERHDACGTVICKPPRRDTGTRAACRRVQRSPSARANLT